MGSAIPVGKESTSMIQQYPEWNPAYVTSAFHPVVEHDKTELLFFWPQMLRSRWHCDHPSQHAPGKFCCNATFQLTLITICIHAGHLLHQYKSNLLQVWYIRNRVNLLSLARVLGVQSNKPTFRVLWRRYPLLYVDKTTHDSLTTQHQIHLFLFSTLERR